MKEPLDTAVNDYLTQFLLRYFRNATAVEVQRPEVNRYQDLELLRLHWAISEPIRKSGRVSARKPSAVASGLGNAAPRGRRTHSWSFRLEGDRNPQIGHGTSDRNRFARAAQDLRIRTKPCADLGDRDRLASWQGAFETSSPDGASYHDLIDRPVHQGLRRFVGLVRCTRWQRPQEVGRRPSRYRRSKRRSRSRRPIYVLASQAYRRLLEIEAGEDCGTSRSFE